MNFPFGTPVDLLKRTAAGHDEYGDETDTVTTETVVGAFSPGGVAGAGRSGSESDTTGVITQPTVYLPPGVDLSSLDAIRVDGRVYEVDGNPIPWSNPFTGLQFGVEVRLTGRES